MLPFIFQRPPDRCCQYCWREYYRSSFSEHCPRCGQPEALSLDTVVMTARDKTGELVWGMTMESWLRFTFPKNRKWIWRDIRGVVGSDFEQGREGV